jgi:hypothetical protein
MFLNLWLTYHPPLNADSDLISSENAKHFLKHIFLQSWSLMRWPAPPSAQHSFWMTSPPPVQPPKKESTRCTSPAGMQICMCAKERHTHTAYESLALLGLIWWQGIPRGSMGEKSPCNSILNNKGIPPPWIPLGSLSTKSVPRGIMWSA